LRRRITFLGNSVVKVIPGFTFFEKDKETCLEAITRAYVAAKDSAAALAQQGRQQVLVTAKRMPKL
jgi:hypothetical protein